MFEPTSVRSAAIRLPARRAAARALAALLAALACVVWTATAAGATAHLDVDYDLDASPTAENRLDLYAPEGASPADRRPVVVYVHGGGWRAGDKRNQIGHKVDLFTGAGYVFASLDYRLSPADPAALEADRVRFPDHPHDVGEAIGWLDRNVAAYGGDPTRIVLIGHSAGAHLVSLLSTDPRYLEAYAVEPWQVIGTIALDTDAYDIAARIAEVRPLGRSLYYNAFGTPAEDAATGSWAAASPISWASAADPEFLLVTQAASPIRVADAERMAAALGQGPSTVFRAPYDHGGINAAVGDPADGSGETAAIVGFVSRVVAAAKPPKARFLGRISRRVRSLHRTARVRLRFTADRPGSTFECRLDKRAFRACTSPHPVSVRFGRHLFRVRALAAGGRPGPVNRLRFRVVGPD